jgi:hypothetical protein
MVDLVDAVYPLVGTIIGFIAAAFLIHWIDGQ